MRNSQIELNKEQRLDIQVKLQEYFLNERGEELGDLAAGMLVDFIINEIGTVIYNKAVEDVHRYMSERVEELLDLQRY